MARVQVSYTHKRPNHYDPHERIQGLAGNGGGGWYRAEDAIIDDIRVNRNSYYVVVGGYQVNVITDKHNGRTYLKTVNDGYAPNNLLNLPEPPARLLP